MKIIAVSGCFLYTCRYDGKEYKNNVLEEKIRQLINSECLLLPVCPEQMGGLPTPRFKSERLGDKVITEKGEDVTLQFKKGAEEVLKILKSQKVDIAILKQKSPSCGCGKIYNGNFDGTLIEGNGLTTELLLANGIKVYSEENIFELKI